MPAAPLHPQRIAPVSTRSDASPGLVLIGTSTGGPAALDVVLPLLPADFPWPVMVAQHMPATFTGPFAKRLDRQCSLQVVEVDRPMPLRRGTIYIGRGDADLTVATRPAGPIARAVPAQRDYPWHPSVERMVSSALEQFDASRLIGVTRLREQGGRTIAEAETTAVVWGMPGELVRNGGADLVLPLEEIVLAIIDMVQSHAVR